MSSFLGWWMPRIKTPHVSFNTFSLSESDLGKPPTVKALTVASSPHSFNSYLSSALGLLAFQKYFASTYSKSTEQSRGKF